jgi:SAM-dependent methyltransferase
MPTHQMLGGATDEELLQRMIDTHPDRFGDAFWTFFAKSVTPRLAPHPRPVMVDLGCGPGLFLRDLGERHATAELCGYDVTPAMIDYGRRLPGAGTRLRLEVRDVSTESLPLAAGSVHLLNMSSVLHVLDEPLPVLAEIRRVLAPDGVFLLNDWIRQPLAAYLAWRREIMKEDEAQSQRRGFRLFPVHNKYTTEDWRWLLGSTGFAILDENEFRASHHIFVATPAKA